jgi:hypothetical protein
MIIRRLADSIRKQDWFVVILEVMIVVVGIFIGLQVDDWNKARQDRKDEQVFLVRLHDELLNSVNVRSFIRDNRLQNGAILSGLMDVLFFDDQRQSLTDPECTALQSSFVKSADIAEMPSYNALMSTGRIHIIQDEALEAALIEFDQLRQTLRSLASTEAVNPGSKYPQLFSLRPRVQENGNLVVEATCDLQALRGNQAFLNDIVVNADSYEAYLTSGLKPLIASIEPLHKLLDANLNLDHDASETVGSK